MIHKLAERTKNLKPPHEYSPWVVINGVHTEILQWKVSEDLKRLVCKLYTGTQPKECQGTFPVLLELYYESDCSKCKSFITENLFPTWKTLEKSGEREKISIYQHC